MPDLTEVLRKVAADLAAEEEGTWALEAEMLISAGLNLQSMDTSLCQVFETAAGPLSLDQKLFAIAEFHRQILISRNLGNADGCTNEVTPLEKLHELRPYEDRESKRGDQIIVLPRETIAEIASKLAEDRPEIIKHLELDALNRKRFAKNIEVEPRLWTVGPSIDAYCQSFFGNIGAVDCSWVSIKVELYIRDYLEDMVG